MSRALPPRTRRGAAVALGLALALGLTGCGAGLRAQTYQERATADATNEAIGALAIRNLQVLPPRTGSAFPAGSDARVGVVVVNEGKDADRLTSVTSDAAAAVSVLGPDGQPATLSVPANAAASGYVFLLRGLTRELRVGQYVRMTLTFAANGSEEMLVPVQVTGSPAPRGDYRVPETDSAGRVLPEEGANDRPELDSDGGDAPAGDAQPDTVSNPIGDGNGGDDADQVPNEG